MTREQISEAARLIEQIDQLQRCNLLAAKAKDMTLNTAGSTLLQIKAEQKDSLFPEIVALLRKEMDRRVSVLEQKLARLGVDGRSLDEGTASAAIGTNAGDKEQPRIHS